MLPDDARELVSRGRRTSATDQNGRTTNCAYDAADRLTTVTNPASNVTSYTYDTENNLLGITDANGHTTNFTYDAYGRVTQTTFPSSSYESYAYDPADPSAHKPNPLKIPISGMRIFV
jgi:YD repeat-containing protein